MEKVDEILVVDDEKQIRKLLVTFLEGAGYKVKSVESAQYALSELSSHRYDALVLDLGLPDMDGVTLLKRVREWSDIPVIVLTARDSEMDKIRALDEGADDYLTKPFSSGELSARIRAMLRRSVRIDIPQTYVIGNIVVDLVAHRVTLKGEEVHLTVKEYELLRHLLVHQGKILTHSQLLRSIWGPASEGNGHYLRVHIAHLRKKLGDNDPERRVIQSESGIGYRISLEN